jgi:hypothetical protein
MKFLSPTSLDLLLRLIAVSGHWGNSPVLGLPASAKGDCAELEKNGLIGPYVSPKGIEKCNFKFATGTVVSDGARKFALKNGDFWSTARAL